jgi:hypothetical protein
MRETRRVTQRSVVNSGNGSPYAARERSAQLVPRLALSQEEAAEALGVSTTFFVEHVRPELRVVLRGRRRLYPVRELERWLDSNASRALEEVG